MTVKEQPLRRLQASDLQRATHTAVQTNCISQSKRLSHGTCENLHILKSYSPSNDIPASPCVILQQTHKSVARLQIRRRQSYSASPTCSVMTSSLLKRNKEADFKVIEESADAISRHLKADEVNPDLDEQFRSLSQDAGRHKYFLLPYKNLVWGQAVEQSNFISFPDQILNEYRKVECASFMGIIPEIHRAWITIDNRLYLWNYMKPRECDVYEGLDETILSVSLSAPKPGIFLDSVKYVLMLATAVEVILLAVSWDANGSSLKLIPTTYTVPTDNTIMGKVIGSQSGRIFMAGNDGNMYELNYQSTESPWAAVFGAGRTHKCQKINHSAWNWKLVHLVPPFLQTILDINDSLIDLIIDDMRNVLYSISARGVLSALYLGSDSKSVSLPIVREMKLFEGAQRFLSYQLPPESSPQAGAFRDVRNMTIIGMFVIPITESRNVHLLVILNNGMRIFLRLISMDRLPYRPGFGTGGNKAPVGVEIVHIRNPPSPDVIRSSLPDGHVEGSAEVGSMPAYMPMRPLKVHTAMYSHGLLLAALERDNAKEGDDLLSIFEDLAGRNSTPSASPILNSTSVYPTQPPSMREGLCVPHGASNLPSVSGKIHDIKESCMALHCDTPSMLQALYMTSATSADYGTQEGNTHSDMLPYDSVKDHSECPVGTALVIARAGQPNGRGLQRNNMMNISTLGEITRQHIPCPTHSLQRQILILTNQGIHILQKLRPVDYLYRFLSQDDFSQSYCVRDFFALYGTIESACMCLGIACGLPADAGGSRHVDPSVIARDPARRVVQNRAISAMLSNSVTEPCFRSVITSTTTGGNALFGRAMDARLVNNPISPDIHLTYSPVHEAFQQLASRILRPIWHRAIAAPVSKKGGPLGALSPIWTRDLIFCIQTPLGLLLKILEELYPDILKADPTVHEKIKTTEEGSHQSSTNGRQLVTRQLELKANLAKNPEKALLERARTLEDLSLRGLYRLISRSLHGFALLDLLRSAQDEKELPVPWGTLKKISFRNLVTSQVVHDEVKKMLVELLGNACKVGEFILADQLTTRLTAGCFQYFSAGDRYAYEASRSLEGLKKHLNCSLSRSSPAIVEQVTRCIELLCKSSTYWRSIPDVKDNFSAVTGDATSELSKSCAQLRSFGEAGRMGIVSLCVTAAQNFKCESGSTGLVIGSLSPFGARENKENWNLNLYHGGSNITEAEKLEGRRICFECLLRQIMSVKGASSNVGSAIIAPGDEVDSEKSESAVRTMIEYALSLCSDPLFRSMLFECLLLEDTEVLIKLRPSGDLEEFLTEKDPILLYKYYRLHGLFVQAAQRMDQLSRAEDDVDILVRIEYLNRAVSSASAACDVTTVGGVGAGGAGSEYQGGLTIGVRGGMEEEYLVELEGKREIARFQLMAFEHLDQDYQDLESHRSKSRTPYSASQKKSMETLSAVAVRLRLKLVGISELFNEICLPYKLWEICLLLMHATRTDDRALASKLLRSVIYRIVPEEASSPEGRSLLAAKRIQDYIFVDARRQQREYTFESHSRWIGRLTDDITALGSQLHGVEADFAFPLVLLLEELEDIASALCSTPQGGPARGWTVDCMSRIGLTCGSTIEYLMGFTDKWGSKSSERRAHILSSTSYCLMGWMKIAMSQSSAKSAEIDQFYQVARSGRLKLWVEKIRRYAPNTQHENLSQATIQSLAAVAAEAEEMKIFIDELMIS